MKTKRLLVTGTGTGCGKTVMTCLLLGYLKEQGWNARAVKPLAAGGANDAQLLLQQQPNLSLQTINPWCFQAPLTPWWAARRESVSVTRNQVEEFLDSASRKCDVLIIEGAGGLKSPLGPGFNFADLIRPETDHVVVVAFNALGVLNGMILTVEALQAKGVPTGCLVLNDFVEQRDESAESNQEVLTELLGLKWAVFRLPAISGGALEMTHGSVDQKISEKTLAPMIRFANLLSS